MSGDDLDDFELPDYGLDSLEVDLDAFDLAADADEEEDAFKIGRTRYIKPRKTRGIKKAKFQNAAKFVKEIAPAIENQEDLHILLGGDFVFGDIFPEIIINFGGVFETLSSTLSYSPRNIESLRILQDGGRLKGLDLIVSDAFYSMETKAAGAIPITLEKLDRPELCDFQLATASVHTKIYLIKMKEESRSPIKGRRFLFYGSANMRSSGCAENIVLSHDADIWEFYKSFHDGVIRKYYAINKDVPVDRRKSLRNGIIEREREKGGLKWV